MFDANVRFWLPQFWLPQFTDAAAKSAFVLVMTLFLWAVMRRAPAASRHLTLLAGIAVLFGLPLLMPFVPRQSLPPIFFSSVFSRQPAVPAPPSVVTTFVPAPSVLSFRAATPQKAPLSLPSPAHLTTAPKQASPSSTWRIWLLLGWLGGVLISAVRILAAHRCVWRLLRGCPPLPTAFRESLGSEPCRNAVLRLGPAGTSPLVWGGLRPVLLLPADALAWSPERIRAVLLHETAHIERRDWLTQTLTQTVCVLYWFNPLVWFTAFQMQAEAERACDDAVLLAGVPPADYAQSLLAVARSLTAARSASAGAVTMARRSPVRGRLEAILDTARPRHRVTRRAAALILLAALAVAVPLAALHPAVRADAPTAGGPTAANIAPVQQRLQSLEQERVSYTAAHPNTLSPAQIAVVDKWLQQNDLKRGYDRFDAQENAKYIQARAEAKKPHSKSEQKEIWRTIFSYERPPASVVKNQRDFNAYVAQLKNQVDALPAEQVTRETQLYAFDSKIALDRTRAEAMEMERRLGYSLHLSEDSIITMAYLGFQGEKDEHVLRTDSVHIFLLFDKLGQHKLIEDSDIDALIAILHKPGAIGGITHEEIMGFFRRLPDTSPIQQQKIREAVTPFLTSQDKSEQKFAQRVIKKYGSNTPIPLPLIQTPRPKGVSLMTLPKSMKTALRTAAAFTSLAAGLTPNAVSAQPAAKLLLAPKPTPAAPPTTAADTLHWQKIFLQHTIVGTNPALTRWHEGGALPEGVKRLFFLTKDNALLVQATSAGLAKIQEIIKVADVAPRQVQVNLALASVPKMNLDGFQVELVIAPKSEPQGMPTPAYLYLDGNSASELLVTIIKQGRVVESPIIWTSNNVEASMSITGGRPTPAQPTLDSLTVMPRINSDNTITLQLHMTISFAGVGKQRQQINTLRTIRSGSTLALCVPSLKPAGGKDHSLLLFITPTIVGIQSSTTVTKH